jgi:ribosomal protein L6P/L9E
MKNKLTVKKVFGKILITDSSSFVSNQISLLKSTINKEDIKKNVEKLSELNRVFKKRLVLKGLGYRASVESRELSLKLNFSHPTLVNLPKHILAVKTQKKSKKFSISLDSKDKILLGNFAESIFRIKPADTYKGKGFRLRGKKIVIKEIKKK